MAGSNGQIVAPGDEGQQINLTPDMWEGLVTLFNEHGDYLQSGTAGQKKLYQEFSKAGIVQGTSQHAQSNR